MDNSPIEFQDNGKFKRIKAPVRMCGNEPKSTPIDDLKGSWKLTEDILSMTMKESEIKFTVVYNFEHTLILKVESISN
jgi:hypothetical protein